MLPLEELTVGALLRRAAARWPERPALEYRGRVWTYRELDADVDITARRLLAWGVEKGERVGLWCEAEPNNILLLYAAVRIGAVATLLNTGMLRPELKELLIRTDISRLIIGDGYKLLDYPALCAGLTEELPGLRSILYAGLSGESRGFPALEALPEAPGETLAAAEAAVKPEDPGFILYTSGTTSAPKAVLGSQYSRANSGVQQAHDLGATERDRFCVAMPVFHCFCLSVNVLAACAVGACLYLPESRRTTALLEAVSNGKCTVMSSVPTLFHAILARRISPSGIYPACAPGLSGAGRSRKSYLPRLKAASALRSCPASGRRRPRRASPPRGFPTPPTSARPRWGISWTTSRAKSLTSKRGKRNPPARPARSASGAMWSCRAITASRKRPRGR